MNCLGNVSVAQISELGSNDSLTRCRRKPVAYTCQKTRRRRQPRCTGTSVSLQPASSIVSRRSLLTTVILSTKPWTFERCACCDEDLDSSQSRPALVVPGFSLLSGARLVTDRLFPHSTPAVYKAFSATHFTIASFA